MLVRHHFFIGAASLAAFFLMAACGFAPGSAKKYADYRYRVTVEVDTPTGRKSGSTVIEVGTSLASQQAFPSPSKLIYKVRAEAVTVDLGGRGLLFLTLSVKDIPNWPAAALRITQESVEGPAAKETFLSREESVDRSIQRHLSFKGKHIYPRYFSTPFIMRPQNGEPPNAYPLMVTFKDLRQPESAVLLDPDNLDTYFGKGVKLRRIMLEPTSDTVTTGIDSVLPWVTTHKGTLVERPLDVSINQMPIEHTLTARDFTRGIFE